MANIPSVSTVCPACGKLIVFVPGKKTRCPVCQTIVQQPVRKVVTHPQTLANP